MNKAKCLLLAVAVVAMAFIVSCTSDIESAEDILAKQSSSSEGNSQSYGYCLLSESKMCLEGPYTLDDCNSIGGRPSNSCPYSSVALPSSSGGEAPSSSSVETGNEPSSSSDAPSSPSVVPSSSSALPSSPSVVPSSSSVAPSSGSSATSCTASDNTDTHYCSSGVLKEYGSVHDSRDGGKTYKTVVIGTQTWMAENLNYAASGSKCGQGISLSDNNTTSCNTYGRLYNWSTAMNNAPSSTAVPSGVRGVCPEGWHLPSKAEWEVMTTYIGGTNGEGVRLKATTGWNSNGGGTDDYGFSALPGGSGNWDDSFSSVGYEGNWWSASESEYDSNSAYFRTMDYTLDGASWNYGKLDLLSVRCVKD